MKNKKTLGTIILLSACCLFSCNKENQNNHEPSINYSTEYYQNVVYPKYKNGKKYKDEVADPSVVKGDDGYYYLFSTGNGGGKCFRSSDLVNWYIYKNSVISRPTWGDDKGGATPSVWAPDCIKIKDKWIYYYSLSGWGNPIGIGYAISDSISGDFIDKGKLFTCEEIGIQNAIDPCIYIEDDHIYMAVGSFQGVCIFELSDDGMSLLNGADYQKKNKTLIAGEFGNWNGATYEGSYIIKKDDYYYYFGSMGTCCEGKNSTYKVVVGRSKNILGPYIDDNKMPLADTTGKGKIVVWAGGKITDYAGTGHNSIIKDDKGDYWMYYHSYVKDDDFNTRHLMIDKLVWNNDWPSVEGNKPSYNEEIEGPAILVEGD